MIIEKQFKSDSSDSMYTTTLDTTTCQSQCNCKGWIFQRGNKPRSCKHTKLLESQNNINNINVNSIWINDGTSVSSITDSSVSIQTIVAKAQPDNTPSPMLASSLTTSATALKDKVAIFHKPLYVMEEKMDGHRLLVTVKNKIATATARPRANKEANVRTLPSHIMEAFRQFPDGIYDGELYIPNGTSTDVVDLERQEELQFCIFDIIESTGSVVIDRTYTQRRELLEEIFFVFNIDEDKGVEIISNMAISAEAIEGIWKRGGEGVIIKHINSKYKFGVRSADWIKIKRNDSDTLTIVGFEEGLNGPHSIAQLESKDGLKTTVKVLNNEILAEVEKDPKSFIGKQLVISHMGKTNNGIWKHAVWDHVL